MPTARRAPTPKPDDTDLRIKVGIISGRTDRLEEVTEKLVRDQAETRAAVDSLRAAVVASEGRVIAAIESGDKRLEGRLESQDEGAAEIKQAAEDARTAAFMAKSLSEEALVEARRQWPRIAKVAVSLSGAAVSAFVGYFFRHFVG